MPSTQAQGVGALQGPSVPRLDGPEGFLAEVGDSGRGHARPPQDLARVLDAPGGDARQVHLDHDFLDAHLAPAAALDDYSGDSHALELGLRIVTSPDIVTNLRS